MTDTQKIDLTLANTYIFKFPEECNAGTISPSSSLECFREAKEALNRLVCDDEKFKKLEKDERSATAFITEYARAYSHLDALYFQLANGGVYYSGKILNKSQYFLNYMI
jgi:hypothetical protein